MEPTNYPIWLIAFTALMASLPATIVAIVQLVYAIKSRGEIQSGHDTLNAKVDLVKGEVDGKMSKMIEAMENIAKIAVNSSAPPVSHERPSRRTDKV